MNAKATLHYVACIQENQNPEKLVTVQWILTLTEKSDIIQQRVQMMKRVITILQ